MGHNTLRPIRKSLLLYETEAGPHKVRAEHDATPVTPQKGIWRIYMFAELRGTLAGVPEQICIDSSHV